MPHLSTSEEDQVDAVGSRSNPVRFLEQNYEELRKDFVKQRARFLDGTFPPNKSSIGEGLLSESQMARVEWIRPTVSLHTKHRTNEEHHDKKQTKKDIDR